MSLLADAVRADIVIPACEKYGLNFVSDGEVWRFEIANITDEMKLESMFHDQWTGVIAGKEDSRRYGLDLDSVIDTLSIDAGDMHDLGDFMDSYTAEGS